MTQPCDLISVRPVTHGSLSCHRRHVTWNSSREGTTQRTRTHTHTLSQMFGCRSSFVVLFFLRLFFLGFTRCSYTTHRTVCCSCSPPLGRNLVHKVWDSVPGSVVFVLEDLRTCWLVPIIVFRTLGFLKSLLPSPPRWRLRLKCVGCKPLVLNFLYETAIWMRFFFWISRWVPWIFVFYSRVPPARLRHAFGPSKPSLSFVSAARFPLLLSLSFSISVLLEMYKPSVEPSARERLFLRPQGLNKGTWTWCSSFYIWSHWCEVLRLFARLVQPMCSHAQTLRCILATDDLDCLHTALTWASSWTLQSLLMFEVTGSCEINHFLFKMILMWEIRQTHSIVSFTPTDRPWIKYLMEMKRV